MLEIFRQASAACDADDADAPDPAPAPSRGGAAARGSAARGAPEERPWTPRTRARMEVELSDAIGAATGGGSEAARLAAATKKVQDEADALRRELGGGPTTSIDPLEIPAQFRCPISQELMEDPVTTSDGHTYERREIFRCSHRPPHPFQGAHPYPLKAHPFQVAVYARHEPTDWRAAAQQGAHARDRAEATHIRFCGRESGACLEGLVRVQYGRSWKTLKAGKKPSESSRSAVKTLLHYPLPLY